LSRSMCDYRRDSEFDITFIDRLYTRIVSTSNYSATANLHNCYVSTSRSLATDSNNGDSSASCVQVLPFRTKLQPSPLLKHPGTDHKEKTALL
jgi:hypothetical protein